MWDVQEGCEGAMEQLKRWTDGLVAGEFDHLEEIFTEDFQFTVDPKYGGGRMGKADFIAFDRNIKSCSIDLLSVTARKFGDMVTSLIFAEVSETFAGDLGPDMPSLEEMSATMTGAKIAYGSGWRQGANGHWQCFSHHIFGFIE